VDIGDSFSHFQVTIIIIGEGQVGYVFFFNISGIKLEGVVVGKFHYNTL